MAEPNLTEVVSSTWRRVVGDKPMDNIWNSRNLFFALGKKGFKESAAGGEQVEMPLEYAENTTFRSYGELEELDTTRINVFDSALYPWKIAAGTIVVSDLERARNQGASQKYSIVAERVENGKDSHIQDMNEQCWGDGSASADDITGIQGIIATSPSTGTVGSINRANFSFWRNRQNSGAQTSSAFDNLRSAWTTTYNECALGNNTRRPTDVGTTQTVFEGYEQILVAIEQIRTTGKPSKGDIAFPNEMLTFKSARVWYDEDAPSGNAYFINPDNLKVVYLKGNWMKVHAEVDPHNQLASVMKINTFWLMGTNGSRHLGVCNAIT